MLLQQYRLPHDVVKFRLRKAHVTYVYYGLVWTMAGSFLTSRLHYCLRAKCRSASSRCGDQQCSFEAHSFAPNQILSGRCRRLMNESVQKITWCDSNSSLHLRRTVSPQRLSGWSLEQVALKARSGWVDGVHFTAAGAMWHCGLKWRRCWFQVPEHQPRKGTLRCSTHQPHCGHRRHHRSYQQIWTPVQLNSSQ